MGFILKKLLIGLLISMTFLAGCSSKVSKDADTSKVSQTDTQTSSKDSKKEDSKTTENSKVEDSKTENSKTTENSTSSTKVNEDNKEDESSNTKPKEENTQANNSSTSSEKSTKPTEKDSKNSKDNGLSEEVKNYILNGQNNVAESDRLNWNSTFLDKVDINTLHNQYISSGGDNNDLRQFAIFVTSNAPILDNWVDLFKEDILKKEGLKISKLRPLDNDLFQAYVREGDGDVPSLIVSSRTGYFHK